MPPGGAASLREELADCIVQIGKIAPEQAASGVSAFNLLKRDVARAAGGREASLSEVLEDLEPKGPVLRFLVAFHEQKRIYRKQVAAVLQVLVQVDAWLAALRDDAALYGSLPEDLRAVVEGEPLPGAAAATQANAASASELAAPAAPVGGAPSASVASADVPAAAPAAVPAVVPEAAEAPSARSRALSSQPCAAPALPVPASPAAPRTPGGSEALQRQLTEAVDRIARLQPGQPEELRAEAFNKFRQGVIRASSGREAPPESLLSDLEPKGAVLKFLAAFYGRKIYRKQVVAVMVVLLPVRSWLLALQGDAELCAELPDDLRVIMEEVEQAVSDLSPPSAPKGSVAPSASALHGAAAAAALPAAVPAAQAGSAAGLLAAAPPPPDGREGEVPGEPSEADVRAAVAAAGAAKDSTRFEIRKSVVVTDRNENARALLTDAQKKIFLLMEKGAASFSMVDIDDAMVAFETFRRAVAKVVHSSSEDTAFLEALEPKGLILEFLVTFYERQRKYRSRVTATLTRLLAFSSWRDAADADPSIRSAANDLVGDRKDSTVRVGAAAAVNLKTAAAAALSKGGVGALGVRVVAAHNLVNMDNVGKSDPYVRVMLGGKMKRTAIITDNLSPRWDGAMFVFEVPSLDSTLRFEVLDSDLFRDEALGTLEMPVRDAPTQPGAPALRRALAFVPHGELEVELVLVMPPEGGAAAAQPLAGKADPAPAAVSTLLSWAVETLTGAVELSASNSEHKGLVCPAGHTISKRKEGLRWHQSLDIWHQRMCDLCGDEISRKATRWRCHQHCDFDVCEACHAAAGSPE